jgi:NAD(P)-dependent dehydrogenase (short-subunit alcohol dehydrogenase family)
MKRLDNKVAIVTGASKGIGAGVAKAFGAEGAAVIVNYARDEAGAELVVRAITGKGGRAIAGGMSPCQGNFAQGVTRREELHIVSRETRNLHAVSAREQPSARRAATAGGPLVLSEGGLRKIGRSTRNMTSPKRFEPSS